MPFALPQPQADAAARVAPLGDAEELAFLRDRAGWLVRLRWGVLVALLLTAGAGSGLGIFDSPWSLIGHAALLGLANLLYTRLAPLLASAVQLERFVFLQILIDVVGLSSLIHRAGGADNPFTFVFVFPVAIAATLLSRRTALLMATLSSLLYGGMILGELYGLLDHHPLHIGNHALHEALENTTLWRSPAYLTAYLGAFALGQVGIAFFVGTLIERLREAERRRREHERVALSRERLARAGAVAAGVAHTVRNPLHGLLNCVELLRPGVPEADRELLELMREGLERIETVTRRLLTLTREGETQRVLLEPGELVTDALRFLETEAERRGVRLEREVGEAAPLHLDVIRCVEAVTNVVHNAIQASGAGSVVLVRAWEQAQPHQLCIEVRDEGPGIAAEHLGRVFDPFFTTKPIGEGSGLGLPITRRVVEDHGGRIFLESQPGQGTVIRIEIPYPALEASA